MPLQSDLDETMYNREDKVTDGQLGQCNSGNLTFENTVGQNFLRNETRKLRTNEELGFLGNKAWGRDETHGGEKACYLGGLGYVKSLSRRDANETHLAERMEKKSVPLGRRRDVGFTGGEP